MKRNAHEAELVKKGKKNVFFFCKKKKEMLTKQSLPVIKYVMMHGI